MLSCLAMLERLGQDRLEPGQAARLVPHVREFLRWHRECTRAYPDMAGVFLPAQRKALVDILKSYQDLPFPVRGALGRMNGYLKRRLGR